jgi:hypothetical protein
MHLAHVVDLRRLRPRAVRSRAFAAASYAPELGKTMSRHKVEGGDVDAAFELVTAAKRWLEKLGRPIRVVSVYETGYDGFWLHRRLTAMGIENRVVDAASIPVDRRSRRSSAAARFHCGSCEVGDGYRGGQRWARRRIPLPKLWPMK